MMNLQDAIGVIESAPGFIDETTPVGEAWAVVLASINPTPVPVSERLPGPEDCDAEGRCWLLGKVERDWRLINPGESGLPQLKYCFSHWLPATALPVPGDVGA